MLEKGVDTAEENTKTLINCQDFKCSISKSSEATIEMAMNDLDKKRDMDTDV